MNTKKRRMLPIVISIIVLLLIIITVSLWSVKHKKYRYVTARKGDLVEAIYGLGKVKSYRKFEVKVGVMTKVKKVFVKEGENVQQGDPLIQFTDTAVFKAPFDGTVTKLPYNVPDMVLPHAPLLTMQNLEELFLEVSLEQEGALRVATGQLAMVLFESVRGEKFKGKVFALFPKDDEFLAHINVQELAKNVLPGMSADVSIIVGQHKDALLVPISGLSNGQIIVRRDGKKLKIPVKIGGVDGEWAEVIEGDIKMTDEILIKVNKKIKDAKDSGSALLGG